MAGGAGRPRTVVGIGDRLEVGKAGKDVRRVDRVAELVRELRGAVDGAAEPAVLAATDGVGPPAAVGEGPSDGVLGWHALRRRQATTPTARRRAGDIGSAGLGRGGIASHRSPTNAPSRLPVGAS